MYTNPNNTQWIVPTPYNNKISDPTFAFTHEMNFNPVQNAHISQSNNPH